MRLQGCSPPELLAIVGVLGVKVVLWSIFAHHAIGFVQPRAQRHPGPYDMYRRGSCGLVCERDFRNGIYASHATRVLRRAAGRGVKAAPPPDDEVFEWLRQHTPMQNWGSVLDAGTGPDSFQWLASCPVRSITAVTADPGMQATMEDDIGQYVDPSIDKVIVGNWLNRQLLSGQTFSVVLVDYLLGSVDHFAPHFQDGLLLRLTKALQPGGCLLFTGKEPEDLSSTGEVAQLILDAEALRDAVYVLGRRKPYREIPMWWVLQRLKALGFRLHAKEVFQRTVTAEKVIRNLDWATEESAHISNALLRSNLKRQIMSLRGRVLKSRELARGYEFGQDYAIVAFLPAAEEAPPDER
eukprot:TRINITY_DN51994_c0_g1_i2.p1 TRINITY_DN51994_c0_g1~~TRINITY_DN51994_c0_g1_i2.p1  ORF type:complete len:353 (+),score=36.59 TRINITY_DN51994_c0_g1_i2:82-1140(+)